LNDLYTGITRAKKASILISKKSPVNGITLDNIQDSESHPEKYSEKAVEKAINKRI
jgi:ATP-dependent exoDNAse (exonuclease V) alpha subunit